MGMMMAKVFISHAKEDGNLAADIAKALEESGVTTWNYLRDSFPGESYLKQIGAAIEGCEVLVVIISNDAIDSEQMTSEIVRGFELKKRFLPVLWGLSHADFQMLQSEWRGAMGPATSIQIPQSQDGVKAILPRLLGGLSQLKVIPKVEGKPPIIGASPEDFAKSPPLAAPAGPPPSTVSLVAKFDRTTYPAGEDALAYWLAELLITIEGEVVEDGPGVDVALVLDVSGSMDKPNRYPLLCEAVRQFAIGLGPQDRVSVTLFADGAKTVVPFIDGEAAAEDPDRLIRAMDESGMLFGPTTLLAPGLQMAVDGFDPPDRSSGRVRRIYVLTDGELHDTPECVTTLRDFRRRLAEVHVYGFGDGFDAASLKRLVSDQRGGTVKPILNEADIVTTFAHVAAVNRRLIGKEGTLVVSFSPGVACGDAWVFQPTARYLGPISERRVEYLFGGIEAGRRYSLMLEVRLPAGSEPVGLVEAAWIEKGVRTSHELAVDAPRKTLGRHVPEVHRALDILDALRSGNDIEAQLASFKARRELAELENRDPNLIAALDKMIASLSKEAAGVEIETDDQLGSIEQLYLDSDTSSIVSSFGVRDYIILHELLEVDISSLSGPDALEDAIAMIGGHVRSGKITSQASLDILGKYAASDLKLYKQFKKMNTRQLLRRLS